MDIGFVHSTSSYEVSGTYIIQSTCTRIDKVHSTMYYILVQVRRNYEGMSTYLYGTTP